MAQYLYCPTTGIIHSTYFKMTEFKGWTLFFCAKLFQIFSRNFFLLKNLKWIFNEKSHLKISRPNATLKIIWKKKIFIFIDFFWLLLFWESRQYAIYIFRQEIWQEKQEIWQEVLEHFSCQKTASNQARQEKQEKQELFRILDNYTYFFKKGFRVLH